MDEKALMKEMDQLFGAETRTGKQLAPSTVEISRHPSDEAILAYLRGELDPRLRSPETVMQGIIRGDLPNWHSPEMTAHLSICRTCEAKALELREMAEAQPWWVSACKLTIGFLGEFYPHLKVQFQVKLTELKNLPETMIKGLSFKSSASPIGSWGLGEEQGEESREGYAALAVIASAQEKFGLVDEKQPLLSERERRRFLDKICREKNIPRELRQQLEEYLSK